MIYKTKGVCKEEKNIPIECCCIKNKARFCACFWQMAMSSSQSPCHIFLLLILFFSPFSGHDSRNTAMVTNAQAIISTVPGVTTQATPTHIVYSTDTNSVFQIGYSCTNKNYVAPTYNASDPDWDTKPPDNSTGYHPIYYRLETRQCVPGYFKRDWQSIYILSTGTTVSTHICVVVPPNAYWRQSDYPDTVNSYFACPYTRSGDSTCGRETVDECYQPNPFGCGDGQYYDYTTLSCASCGTNRIVHPSSLNSACACAPGYYTTDPTNDPQAPLPSCTICPAGSYCPGGIQSKVVQPCGLNQFADAQGQSACSTCQQYEISILDGGTACQSCPAGTALHLGSCQACPFNQYPFQNYQCKFCPAGQIVSGTTCVACAAGTYSDHTTNQCISCPPNTYNPVAGSLADACLPCPGGSNTAGNDRQLQCLFCDDYHYMPDINEGICEPCPAGTTGEVTPTMVPGTSVNVPQQQCTACPQQNHVSLPASGSCTTCFSLSNELAPPERDICVQCDVNSYPKYPERACWCVQGYVGTPCAQCAPGTFMTDNVDPTGALCMPCPSGTFSNTTAASVCHSCPVGTTTAGPGADDASDCIATTCPSCGAGSGAAPDNNDPSREGDLFRVCDDVYAPKGDVCIYFENNLWNGACPENWYSDPRSVESVAYPLPPPTPRISRLAISPTGQHFALLTGSTVDTKQIVIYEFTSPGVSLAHQPEAGQRSVSSIIDGTCYESIVWSSDGRYLLGFARSGFLIDRYDTQTNTWTDGWSSGSIGSVTTAQGYHAWNGPGWTGQVVDGFPKCVSIAFGNEYMCIYRYNAPYKTNAIFFIGAATGNSVQFNGWLEAGENYIQGDSFAVSYRASADEYQVYYVASGDWVYERFFYGFRMPGPAPYRPFYSVFYNANYVIPYKLPVDSISSKTKIRANPRARVDSGDTVNYVDVNPVYMYTETTGWAHIWYRPTPSFTVQFDPAHNGSLTLGDPGFEFNDWDFLPGTGEMVVATPSSLNRIQRCGICPDGQTSFASNNNKPGIGSCKCPANTYSPDYDQFGCSQCQVCGAGKYELQPCTGTQNAVCAFCRPCEEGEYEVVACGGSQQPGSCAPCGECPAGQYKAQDCDRNGNSPTPQQCNDCTYCEVGEFIASYGSCNGAGTSDTGVICSSCTEITQCTWGQYIADRCDGKTTTNTEVCAACPPCANGFYYSSGCTGLTYDSTHVCSRCDTCPVGSYITDTNGCDGTKAAISKYSCAQCSACPAGQVHSPPCDGLGFSDTCVNCPNCPAGQYKSNVGDVCSCVPCKDGADCAFGEYKVTGSTCDGTTTSDVSCAACTTDCGAGQYLSTHCDGSSTSDISVCSACRASCAVGQFLDPDTCVGTEIQDRQCYNCISSCSRNRYKLTSCDGTSTSDTTTCAVCDLCSVNEYRSTQCTGTSVGTQDQVCTGCANTPTSCAAQSSSLTIFNQCLGFGTVDLSTCAACNADCASNQYIGGGGCAFGPNNYTCINCASGCSSGQYIQQSCNGYTTTDIACGECKTSCPAGFYLGGTACDGTDLSDSTDCVACECPGGQYASTPCDGSATSDNSVCTACTSSCPAGQYLSGTCSTNGDYTCVACAAPCGAAEIEAVPCTSTTNRVCVADPSCTEDCAAGTYLTQSCVLPNTPKICTPCTTCASGSISQTAYNMGEYIVSECTPTSDRVCAACRNPCLEFGANTQSVQFCSGTKMYDEVKCDAVDPLRGECTAGQEYAAELYIPRNGPILGQAANIAQPSLDQMNTFAVSPNGNVYYIQGHYSGADAIFYNLQDGGSLQWRNADRYHVKALWDPTSTFVYLVHAMRDDIFKAAFDPTWATTTAPAYTAWHTGTDSQGGSDEASNTRSGCVHMEPAANQLFCAFGTIKSQGGSNLYVVDTTSASPTKQVVWTVPNTGLGDRMITSNPAYDVVGKVGYVFSRDADSVTGYNALESRYVELWSIPFTNPTTTGTATLLRSIPMSSSGKMFVYQFLQLVVVPSQSPELLYWDGTIQDTYVYDHPFTSVNGANVMRRDYYTSNALVEFADTAVPQLWTTKADNAQPYDAPAMYARCFPCPTNSFALAAASSVDECRCNGGFYWDEDTGSCVSCKNGANCNAGEYKTGDACEPGHTFDVTCAACEKKCQAGEYSTGSCDGTSSVDTTQCTTCKSLCSAPLLGCSTSNDCTRSQVFTYYMDGDGDALSIDKGPNNLHLKRESVSGTTSQGPTRTPEVVGISNSASAFFNPSSHERFAIPSSDKFFLGGSGGTTISMWIRLHAKMAQAAAGASNEVLLEWTRNGPGTATVAIRRNPALSPSELEFHVSHSGGTPTKTLQTTGTVLLFTSTWQHISWTMTENSPSAWDIRIDNTAHVFNAADGVFPETDVVYAQNYLGHSSSTTGTAFLHGSMDDVRMFSRVLQPSDLLLLFNNDPCCGSGALGEYVGDSDSCTGFESYDSVPCMGCRTDCGKGNFIASGAGGDCDGSGTEDSTHCQACGVCSAGQYMSSVCDGTTPFDAVTCGDCGIQTQLQCADDHFLVNACTGLGTSDTAQCVLCATTCQNHVDDPLGRGQYISSLCTPGNINDFTCTHCSGNCAPGEFISEPCDGKTLHDRQCTPCRSTCPSGQYISLNGCADGSAKSSTDPSTCVVCNTCPGAFSPDKECDGTLTQDVTCVACPPPTCTGPEEYVRGTCGTGEVVECVSCSWTGGCPAGYTETQACTSTTDRVCVPTTTCEDDCPAGFYQAEPCTDISIPKVCTACTTCSAGKYQATDCTPISDAVCNDCRYSCVNQPSAGLTTDSVGGSCDGTSNYDTVECYNSNNAILDDCPANFYQSRTLLQMNSGGPLFTSTLSMVASPNNARILVSDVYSSTRELYVWDWKNEPLTTSNYLVHLWNIVVWIERHTQTSESYYAEGQAAGWPSAGTNDPLPLTYIFNEAGDEFFIFFSFLGEFALRCPVVATSSENNAAAYCDYQLQVGVTTGDIRGCTNTGSKWIICTFHDYNKEVIMAFDAETSTRNAAWTYNILVNGGVGDYRIAVNGIGYYLLNNLALWISYDNAVGTNAVQVSSLSFNTATGTTTGVTRGITHNEFMPSSGKMLVHQATGDVWQYDTGDFNLFRGSPAYATMDHFGTLPLPFNSNLRWLHGTVEGMILALMYDGNVYQYTECGKCPSGSVSPASSTTITACQCPDDTYGDINSLSDECKPCAVTSGSGGDCAIGEYKTGTLCTVGNALTSDVTCAACTQSCAAGQYIANACDGTQTSNTATCTACQSSCPAGQFLHPNSLCTGSTTTDVTQCIPCKTSCDAGFYLSGSCSGSGTSDEIQCLPCTQCPLDTYITNQCTGSGTSDTVICAACQFTEVADCDTVGCGSANNLPDVCKTPTTRCSGQGTSDNSACTICNTNCAADEYISQVCLDSNPLTDDFTCAKCSGSCATGEYISTPCDGTTLSDRACSPCKTSCPAGNYLSGTCNGQGSSDTTTCVPCQTCNLGVTYQDFTCAYGNTTADVFCLDCSDTCQTGQYISSACSATYDIRCSQCLTTCNVGSYLSGGSIPCLGNTTSDPRSCIACQNCPSGQYRTNVANCNGNTTFDPVGCAACTEQCATDEYVVGSCDGTSSTDDQSCATCKYCPDTSVATQYTAIAQGPGCRAGIGTVDDNVCGNTLNYKIGDDCPVNHYVPSEPYDIARGNDRIVALTISPNRGSLAILRRFHQDLAAYQFDAEEASGNSVRAISTQGSSASSQTTLFYAQTTSSLNQQSARSMFWGYDEQSLFVVDDDFTRIHQWDIGSNAWSVFYTHANPSQRIVRCTSIDAGNGPAPPPNFDIICRVVPTVASGQNGRLIKISQTGALDGSFGNSLSLTSIPSIVSVFNGQIEADEGTGDLFVAMPIQYSTGFGVTQSWVWKINSAGNSGSALPLPSGGHPVPDAIYDLAIDTTSTIYFVDRNAVIYRIDAPHSGSPKVIPTPYSPNEIQFLEIWTRNRLVMLVGPNSGATNDPTTLRFWTQCAPCAAAQNSPGGQGGVDTCECGAGSFGDGVTFCEACKNGADCDPGEYKTGLTCTDPDLSQDVSCGLCKTPSACATSRFLGGTPCDGTSSSDTTSCEPCLTCNAGTEFLTGECAGLQTPTAQCNPCRTTCSPGFYLEVGTCSTYADTVCTQCATYNGQCGAGFYPDGLCLGTTTSDTTTCQPCTSITCPAGFWRDDSLCNGFNDPSIICKSCTTCDGGIGVEFQVAECMPGNATGLYTGSDAICQACTAEPCPPNQYRTAACSATTDLQCETCSMCNQLEALFQGCTATTNTICGEPSEYFSVLACSLFIHNTMICRETC